MGAYQVKKIITHYNGPLRRHLHYSTSLKNRVRVRFNWAVLTGYNTIKMEAMNAADAFDTIVTVTGHYTYKPVLSAYLVEKLLCALVKFRIFSSFQLMAVKYVF